jgi:hypothetical protein
LEPPPEAPCQRISIHLPDVVAYGAGALAAPSGSARRLLAAIVNADRNPHFFDGMAFGG